MNKSFLAFSCPHCPLQDEDAIDWLLGRITDLKPDYVIHLGDGHEADSASKWNSEYTWDLGYEFETHNALLKKIRMAYKPASRVFLDGNHDANIQAPHRIPPKLRGLCNMEDHEPELDYWARRIYEFDKFGTYNLGQVTFSHGYQASGNAGKLQSVVLGKAYGLFVSGHTHRPENVVRESLGIKTPLNYWHANPGCMRHLKPDFVKTSSTVLWGHGIVVGEAQILKSPRESKCWDAHTEVYQDYNQWLDKQPTPAGNRPARK